ncbi:GNAT family N-acetyltransferase [Nocardiopsis ansamitocini]|uniref:GCN5 family N-acetyltransferase n=1 Tax=Nocardiopsis ansamitocini TaxID=1670832 RepID=A0A9W6UG24_9ACTN|nr:GNAT family N-acetyltransferase [Nocardiopsis ansamitocini]GLU46411.1 GCN5 family N-acetyltransferase [Nocardiopsis ansamitocini]
MDYTVRPMEDTDLDRLVEVSLAADGLFARAGLELPPDDPRPMLAHCPLVLVAGRPAAGLAALTELDGNAHLEQIAVHPTLGRRGIGTALLTAACAKARAQGHRAITLTTFGDLAWNAPWYARNGFTEFPRGSWGPELAVHWLAEEAAGIAVARRIAMRRLLTA